MTGTNKNISFKKKTTNFMRYPVYTELNAFPIGYKVFEYYLNSCVLLIDKQNESCRFSTQ